MALSSSTYVRTGETKRKAAIAAIATALAKKNGDPLYVKLAKYRKLWKDHKEQIMRKYGAQAAQKWAEAQNRK